MRRGNAKLDILAQRARARRPLFSKADRHSGPPLPGDDSKELLLRLEHSLRIIRAHDAAAAIDDTHAITFADLGQLFDRHISTLYTWRANLGEPVDNDAKLLAWYWADVRKFCLTKLLQIHTADLWDMLL